jgi:hypothetical protein
MNTLKTLIRAGVCGGIALTLSGCLTSTPQWDAHFGETVQQITASQVINPHAGTDSDPVSGIDGGAATANMFRYDKSFAQPLGVTSPYGVGLGSASITPSTQ